MKTDEQIKQVVKEKYGEIAVKSSEKKSCGCCCTSKVVDYSMFKDNYENLDGYVAEADLGLGCGLPTEFANIKKGDTVVDLGAGAGNDVFVARAVTGETGRVIGIDMTQEMIDKANENKAKLGFENVEFKFGEIESMPLQDNEADVVVSNCVLNLVPNKDKAFEEIFRILKPGAHFCVSDIVLQDQLNDALKISAEMYAGCVAGALQKDDYLKAIENAGFTNIEIKKTKTVELPDELLKEYLSDCEIEEYKANKVGIFSITVVGDKK
ncbi:arsenite methyltransferase [Calditrichota bacterium]